MTTILKLAFMAAPVVGGTAVFAWRIRETQTPVTAAKILVPPLGMSTGFMMFLNPSMRVPWSWAVAAFLLGALVLAIPLARSSSLERRGDEIMMRRSPGFLLILLGLLALRLLLHDYVGHLLSPAQTAAVFFLLAFGMIARWRIAMFRRFRTLQTDRPTQ